MIELEVQTYLRIFSTTSQALKKLEERFHINATPHKEYPNLYSLKYDQLESPMNEKIVQQCRGLIVDSADNWNIVAYPFTKFFNAGETLAATIDWETASVQEKLDGSLCVLYYYDNQWHVATSGTPDASGNVYGFPFTFKELFWKVWNDTEMKLPTNDWRMFTFLFELTTPFNKIVIPHKESKITLLGVRDIAHGREYSPRVPPPIFNWPVVKSFPLQKMDDVLLTFNKMNPLEQEGYVIVDNSFNRVKVKHPGYVALHHLRDAVTSSRRILELCLLGETTEVVNAFPEYEELFNNTNQAIAILSRHLHAKYLELKDIPVQKDFALEAVKTMLPDCLFSLRKGYSTTVIDYLKNMRSKNLLDLLRKEFSELMKYNTPSE